MPTKPIQKLILTHIGNLITKYAGRNCQPSAHDITRQEDDLDRLKAKLEQLIAFDRNRGITTEIVYLDNDGRLHPPVSRLGGFDEFKRAVDEIYRNVKPAYMLILGGSDIVPFIPLRDPCIPQSMQGLLRHRITVENIPSDLPYACDQPCNTRHPETCQVSNFKKPTRMVSRCPDVDGDADMGIQVLLRTLDHIMQLVPRPVSDDWTPWAVCTPARTVPLGRVLQMMYGSLVPTPYFLCAPHNSTWTIEQYRKTVHVHIVHGSRRRNMLYGETQNLPVRYPLAILSDRVDSNVTSGTVVLEMACFGGQLYNPQNGKSHRSPLVNMYLACGAACVLGSTLTTFSDPDGVLMGDYMMAKFFQFLHNRTVGRALLLTRRWLMSKYYPQERCNEDMRMFAAFNLYGDVSAMPISDTPHPDFAKDARDPINIVRANGIRPNSDAATTADRPGNVAEAEENAPADSNQTQIRLPGGLQVNRMADHTQADGNMDDSPDFSSPETADAESGAPCPLEADDPNSGSSQETEEENNNIYPLEADEKLEIPKNVEDAIQGYLLKTYQIKSVDFIVCNQLMQNDEILKDRLQFTAYAADAGTLESNDRDMDGQGADRDNNEIDNLQTPSEYGIDDKQENDWDGEMERPVVTGAFFVFQTPGKTPEEAVEFLWGYTCN